MKKPPYICILLRERRILNALLRVSTWAYLIPVIAHPSISSLSKHLSSNLFDIQTVF